MKGRADYFKPGDWNSLCYVCGEKYKASELKRHWRGYYACPSCWEPRQPQDFVRAVPDAQTPPWIQARPAEAYVLFCTPVGSTAIPGGAMPGCVIPNYIHPMYYESTEGRTG